MRRPTRKPSGQGERPLGRLMWRRVLRLSWRLAFGLLLATWVLALFAWLSLHWLILPRLDDWRGRVEQQASRALGHPVQIGQIKVRSSGWVPAFELQDVVLHDKLGREALRLPQVSAALSVPSLLAFKLRFEQLLIENARLEVRRDAAGRWSVAGLDVDASATAVDGGVAADWFFEQHEFVIRGGLLRWVDEQRAAPPLQLSDVQLVVRNRGRSHELRLDATPPPEWGQRFAVLMQARGPLLARAGDWQRWKGTVFADLPLADVASLRRHVDLPVDLRQGEATLRAWVDWDQGLPQALTLDAALRHVSVRLAPALEPLAFERLSGRVVAERQPGGVKLALEQLAFSTTDGQHWAASQMALQWRQTQAMALGQAGASHPITGGEFSADRLDLAALAVLAERLPVGRSVRGLLRPLNPEGTVQALKAQWDGPLDAPRRYSAQASVHGLAIAAGPSPEPGGIGRPGWHGADLEINASETGGHADLKLDAGSIELPGVFEQAVVPLRHFGAQLQWRVEPVADQAPRIELKVLNARFDNDDARGALAGTWHTGAGPGFGKGGRLPGVLELAGTLAEGKAARVARYLPMGIGAGTRAWVQRAVQGGVVRDASYRVKGDLWEFPFVNRRDGEFRIAAQLQDVTLAPVPSAPRSATEPAFDASWPAFTGVSGELVFERNSMQFQQATGRLWGVELSGVQGRIRELSVNAVLELEGSAHGPAADLLRYVNTTPVGGWTGNALAQATASGAADLKLALNIPLAHSIDTVVKLGLQLPGNDLRIAPTLPLLANARGRIEATHKGLEVAGVRTQVAGGEAVVNGGTQADGSLRFAVNGTASAEGLRRTTELATVARLAQRLQGQTSYRLQLGLRHGLLDWQVASALNGMAIDLPAPLTKAAEGSLALRVSSTPQVEPRGAQAPDQAGDKPADKPTDKPTDKPPPEWLRLELGALQASVLLDTSPAEPRVLRGALAYGAALPEPVVGGRAVLALPRLDVAPWQALWDSAGAAAPASTAALAASASASNANASAGATAGLHPSWMPRSVQLKTPELLAGGRRLTGVTVDLQRLSTPGDEGWRAQVVADQTAGTVDYREPRGVDGAGGAGRIKARLSRLSLPPSDADTVADTMAGMLNRAPASVPALDIEIDDFELRGRKLGRLAVEAVNRVPGAAPTSAADETRAGPKSEWQLNRLQLSNPEATLTASGRWLGVPGVPGSARRRMALDFKLDIGDAGALLQRLGFGRVMRGAKGQMKGSLGWDGSPLGLDLPTLGGTLDLALDNGQFLKVDAGAARLLGVLSLQALPRRFLLDFRDVFQEGFAFDNLAGDVQIARGVASTKNLRLRGLQAVVVMEGSADLLHETQDLHVLALPELNTASAALAYAAINPAIGLGAFLGQLILREPLRQASAREFHVSGSWDDPKVDRVERGLLDPRPAGARDAPTAAPAASMPAVPAVPAAPISKP